MSLVTCAECGNSVSDQAANCVHCGAPVKKQDVMFCTKCGKEIFKEAISCPACGIPTHNFHQQQYAAPVNVNVSNVNTNSNINTNMNMPGYYGKLKNKWVSLILCFCFGFFGVHKFYEEKIGMGIIYLFTAGLFFVGPVIDFIVLLFKPNPYYV